MVHIIMLNTEIAGIDPLIQLYSIYLVRHAPRDVLTMSHVRQGTSRQLQFDFYVQC